MTHQPNLRGPGSAGRPSGVVRTDYTGAVHGSLLAASVVAGASTPGPYPRVQLVLLLLCTGVVFWAAHVYSALVGELLPYRTLTWSAVRRRCAHEWPIAQAAVAPAAAVAISPLLGLGLEGTAWLGLGVAVAQQVAWASAGGIRAGASRRAVVSVGAVNLALGLVLVAAKVAIQH
ncbi:hypothetical protein [Streptomyces peucetius]|uniref:Integral membrane protein n=1 Tax=Streptomyces peucetius TaxID=1950 RepID=A0ABY6IDB1_STRPE|nr:hypothetical protein [Streptomyces peucetius]UYQ64985.1 hypothetical protein OGH68_28350 [Streptomyces peucetius]